MEVLGVHPASLLRCGKHRVTVSEERFYKGKWEQPKNLGLLEVNVGMILFLSYNKVKLMF